MHGDTWIWVGVDILIVVAAIWLTIWGVSVTFGLSPFRHKKRGLVRLKEREWRILEGTSKRSREKRGLW